jgi:hypothetical protein
MPVEPLPTTEYFRFVRGRPDRAIIRDEWIRVRRPDRVTVHNAFFDRSFKP